MYEKEEYSSLIDLADGTRVKLGLSGSGITISNVKTDAVLYSFDSSDLKGLKYLDDNPQEYLLGKISSDSDVDEVLDTLESIKDNIKELYRKNPNLINYYTGENLPKVQTDVLADQPLTSALEKHGQSFWKQTWFIVALILVVLFLIPLRHSIRCSLQGGEIRDYKPTYQVVRTGETFEGDSLQSACVKETSTGYETLFNIR